jgi:Flp pilus assembly pilin Flp
MKRFLTNQDGATAIEYGLIGVLISVAIVTIAITVGEEVVRLFGTIRDSFPQVQ